MASGFDAPRALARASVVNVLTSATLALGLSNDTLMRAVALFDGYSNECPPHESDVLPWVAAASIRVAAKECVSPRAVCRQVGVELGATSRENFESWEQYLRESFAQEEVTVCTHLRCAWFAWDVVHLPHLVHASSYLAELALLENQLRPVPAITVAEACLAYACVLTGHDLAPPCEEDPAVALAMHVLSGVHGTVTEAWKHGRPYAATVKYLSCERGAVAALPAVIL